MESGDGGDYVIAIEELEKISAKGGITLRSTARSPKLVVANRKKLPAGPRHLPSANLISQISKSWKHPPKAPPPEHF